MYWLDRIEEVDGEDLYYFNYYDIVPVDMIMTLVTIKVVSPSLEDFLDFYEDNKQL